ncbi:condensin complex subunit 3 [Microplitis mediator]|uniref:condensin complex subunit 3 n=1 Tax=Microplitis mediator TaxID=375433 RepID=UPI0025564E24|nr:condensin complex subunit 3 [Microplitis mediator]
MSAAEKRITEIIRDTFDNVQVSKTCHKKYVEKLTKVINNNDLNKFTEIFIKFMQVFLAAKENSKNVINALDFVVTFAMSLPPDPDAEDSRADEEDDAENVSLSAFALKILDHCLKIVEATSKHVRYHVCQLIDKMLKSMPDNAIVDDYVLDSIQKALIARCTDRAPKVRTQVMYAMGRLQEPNNEQCHIQRLYKYHMNRDPCADVRVAVIQCMSVTRHNINEVIRRVDDINHHVRKAAYLYLSKVSVNVFSIRHRVEFMQKGLSDDSSMVRTAALGMLDKWCDHYDKNYPKLLEALEAQTFESTSIKVLNVIFGRTERDKLIKQIPLDEERKLIPIDELTSETALYWRCLIEYLNKESCEEKLDECRPELSKFCAYILEYQTMMSNTSSNAMKQSCQVFILCQLYKIAMVYDLSDEVGRRNLDKLIRETLQSEKCPVSIIELITLYYEKVEPDVDRRVERLTHIISEIRSPSTKPNVVIEQLSDEEQHQRKMLQSKKQLELRSLENEMYRKTAEQDFIEAQKIKEKIIELQKEVKELAVNPIVMMEEENIEQKDDPDTMMRCLTIACCMVQVTSVTTLNSILRSLYDNLVLPSLNHTDAEVQLLTLKTNGIFLWLDEQLAKERFWHYLLIFTHEEVNVDFCIESLKVVFDLLIRYGLETFDCKNDETSTNETTDLSRRSRKGRTSNRLHTQTSESISGLSLLSENQDKNFITIITALCDNTDDSIRTIATEGLCKLLLAQRLSSVNLVSRLVIMLFNPANEGATQLLNTLRTFFSLYPNVENSQDVLERTFMPTLRTISHAPNESPLLAIELENVAGFILQIIDCARSRIAKDHSAHNNLAVAILAEALTSDNDIDRSVLLKSLKHLNVDITSDQMKQDLITTIDEIAADLKRNEKNLMICLSQFKKKIEGVQDPVDGQDANPQETEGDDQEQEEDHIDIEDSDNDE